MIVNKDIDTDNDAAPDSTVDEKDLVTENYAKFQVAKNNDVEDGPPEDCVGGDGIIVVDKVKLTLLERDLWTKFSKLGTEMIITKAGR